MPTLRVSELGREGRAGRRGVGRQDAIRNIIGQLGSIWSYKNTLPGGTGALSWTTSGEGGFAASSKITMQGITFDASCVVPTADGKPSGQRCDSRHSVSWPPCLSFCDSLRVSELGREVTGRRAPRRGTLFGRSMVHSLDHLHRLMLVPLALFQVSLAPTTCFRGHKVSRWQKWSLKLPGLSRPLRKTVRSISLSRPFCISASRPKLECRDTR